MSYYVKLFSVPAYHSTTEPIITMTTELITKKEIEELSSILKRANELFATILKRVDKRSNELEHEYEKMEMRTEDTCNKVGNKVVFDVGGKKFAISKSTLLNTPDSYFSSLLRSDNYQACVYKNSTCYVINKHSYNILSF